MRPRHWSVRCNSRSRTSFTRSQLTATTAGSSRTRLVGARVPSGMLTTTPGLTPVTTNWRERLSKVSK